MTLSSRQRVLEGGAGLAALAVCGWYEAAMRPFGLGSSVVTFAAAGAVLGLGTAIDRRRSRLPARGGPRPTRLVGEGSLALRGLVAWGLAAGLVLAVELWELFHTPRALYPTLSSLANDVVGPGHRFARTAAFICWGACGVLVASRPRRRA
jgi:hypothetical protein